MSLFEFISCALADILVGEWTIMSFIRLRVVFPVVLEMNSLLMGNEPLVTLM